MKKRNSNRIFFKRSRTKILLLFFVPLLFFNCAHTKSVSFLYTGKSNGILENCNCPKNKYGGLLNRLHFFESNIDSVDMLLDAGDFFSYSNNSQENVIILNLLSRFKYNCITPGELDLNQINVLKDIFVSQNIKGLDKEKYLTINGINICITGAISPNFKRFDKYDVIEKVNIEEIGSYTKRLKHKCDLLIFLSHLEIEDERRMFIDIPEIDVMVSGHSGIRTHETFDNRIYVSPGRNSEFVGKLELTMNKDEDQMYKIMKHRNKFYSMHIDSVAVDINAKNFVDSMKVEFKMKVNKNENNGYE